MRNLSVFVAVFACALTAATLPPSTAAEKKELVKVCFLNWGKQGGEHLPEQGFNPDLVSTVLREAGYEPEVRILPWVRCLEETKQHKYAFVAGYWRGGEGDKWFDYFHPTTVDRINFVVMKESDLTSGRLEDLYGRRVGYLRGAGGLKEFKDRIERFKAFEASKDLALIKMLRAGRIDAIISNSPHITSLAETSFPDMVGHLRVLQPAIQVNIAAPAISWTHPKREEMKARYNRAYEKLVKEGIYERLMAKHKIRVDYK